MVSSVNITSLTRQGVFSRGRGNCPSDNKLIHSDHPGTSVIPSAVRPLSPTRQSNMIGSTTNSLGDQMGEQQRVASRGAGAEEPRRHNLRTLLAHVHLRGRTSRSHLATVTGLNRSTIADLVTELSTLGLVVEQRTSTTAGPGRPTRQWSRTPAGGRRRPGPRARRGLDAIATVGLGGHIFNLVRIDRPAGASRLTRPSRMSSSSPSRCSHRFRCITASWA